MIDGMSWEEYDREIQSRSVPIAREDYGSVGTIDADDLPPEFPPSWRLHNDVEIMALPEPEFLIADILPRRSVGALVAPPGVGKTTLATSIGISLATGRDWFGHSVLHRGVTIVGAAEDPGGLKMRLRAGKQAARLPLDVPIGVYCFPEVIDLRDAGSVARFTDFLSKSFENGDLPRELLIIDTYAASTPGSNENSSEDTTTAMTHAQQWRDRLGLTVLLIHHTNASATRERGHSAMRGAADFMLAMVPEDDVVNLECTKMRNGPAFQTIKLRLTNVAGAPGCVFRLASDVLPDGNLSPNQAKALTTLKDVFGAEGATKSEWQRTCADIPERTFHRASKTLIERGFVKQVGTHFRVTGGGR